MSGERIKDFVAAVLSLVVGVWLFVLLIGLFSPDPENIQEDIQSCCWVRDQYHRQHYIGPIDERIILGIPIREE